MYDMYCTDKTTWMVCFNSRIPKGLYICLHCVRDYKGKVGVHV